MIEPQRFHSLIGASNERRLFPRLTTAVQIELRVKDSSAPIRLRTTDISVGGCYVETAVTLEPGTLLTVILWLGHDKVTMQGRVATKHPHFGNGLEFVGVSPESQEKVQQFLEKAENSRAI